eukprot:7220404-Pyramimonas_sp.AAC.1
MGLGLYIGVDWNMSQAIRPAHAIPSQSPLSNSAGDSRTPSNAPGDVKAAPSGRNLRTRSVLPPSPCCYR